MAGYLFCQNGVETVEAGKDTRIFEQAGRGQAGALEGTVERVAKRIFRIEAEGKTFTMISMEDITVEEAERFCGGKWHGAKVKS